MTWLVFGVSCLLVLAGAISIISGAPMIQLERGWAEVIAGTVALSSGGVVFALAGILMRLESLRDTVAARAIPVAAELPPRPAPLPAAEPVPPAPAAASLPEPEAAVTTPAVAAAGEEQRSEGLWKRVKRPEAERTVAERPDPEALRQHGFPDRVVPDEPAPAPPASDAPVLVPAHPVPAVPDEASVGPTVATPAEAEAGQIGWLERSLFRGRAGRPGEPAGAARTEPSPDRLPFQPPADLDLRPEPHLAPDADRPIPRPPLFSAPTPSAAAEPEPTPDLASEQHDGATVIGRYQAGSASYVMYSDGTIEVETEGGEIHRFGSMDELKAFIAQQDATVP